MGHRILYIPRKNVEKYFEIEVNYHAACSPGIVTLYFTGKLQIDLGDGSTFIEADGPYYNLTHTYSAYGDYTVRIYYSDTVSEIRMQVGANHYVTYTTTGNMPDGLNLFSTGPRTKWIATTSDFPSTVKYLYLTQGITGSSFTGDIANLPIILEVLETQYTWTTITGDIANISRNLTRLHLNCYNTIYGDIADLPVNLDYLQLGGKNIVSGDLSNWPAMSLKHFNLTGQNTVTGDVYYLSTLPIAYGSGYIGHFILAGNNTCYGDISNLPDCNVLQVLGQNTVTGDISAFSSVNMPDLRYIIIQGSNTLYGNINTITKELLSLNITGNNTVTGDIADLPNIRLTYCTITGNNTLFGDVANLPAISNMTLIITGANTISGNIQDIPAIGRCTIAWDNTIAGDVAGIQCQDIWLNDCRVNDYTGKVWPSAWKVISIPSAIGYGLTTSEVDQLLIDLANYVTTWSGSKRIDLRGGHAARSTASDAAVATLQSRGVTVNTN